MTMVEIVTSIVAPFVANKLASVDYSKSSAPIKKAVKKFLGVQFAEYLTEVYSKCIRVKTLISADQSVDLFAVFEPQTIVRARPQLMLESEPQGEDAQAFLQSLSHGKRFILSATAGSGKSMMMRFFAAASIRRVQPFIPIFLELRTLNHAEEPNLMDALVAEVSNYHTDITVDEMRHCLRSGNFLLLLDGFDEVKDHHKEIVGQQIKDLAQRAPTCPIVVSSRPDDRFDGWAAFDRRHIAPLNQAQAISLIQKIEFSIATKEELIRKIKDELWKTHKQFLSNPLLVSMVLLTFKESYDIPSKRHNFYEEAVAALFFRHDARKDFKRDRFVNMDLREFERLFSVFCVRSFIDNVYSFTELEMRRYLNIALNHSKLSYSVDALFSEIIQNVCLLVRDGTLYTFVHRSFQEFFVAKFVVEQSADNVQKLVLRLGADWSSNEALTLTYGLNPQLIETAVIIPFLEEIVGTIDLADGKSVLRGAARSMVRVGIDREQDAHGQITEYVVVSLVEAKVAPINALKFYITLKLLRHSRFNEEALSWPRAFSVESPAESSLMSCKDEPPSQFYSTDRYRSLSKYSDEITRLFTALSNALRVLKTDYAERQKLLSDLGI